ncbi:MAG: flagellin [Ferrovibrio sp.]|uniref:flagellin n=1 Tax=Ferrovibrio TaxID=1231242 RepID=UPI00262CC099|nr:flagellin [Ferrovibrio sp.]MCW0235088.1 flagellin [Ferrovibrio sp.]
MTNSVNTNIGALVALSSLRGVNSELDTTSKRVQTGYKVADASDDAAVFAVAQGIRGNIKAYASVQSSLAAGEGLGQVTASALTGISDLIGDIKAKFANLADGSLTSDQRTVYQNDVNQLVSQIQNYIGQATYNGKNLLTADTSVTFVADVSGTTLTLQTGSSLSAAAASFSSMFTGGYTAASNYSSAMADLGTLETLVNSISAQVAAQSRSITLQKDFVDDLVDATKTGLGALVDADVAAESATLQSLQVRQQLAIQALSIANQQPNTLLSLFR